MENLALSGLIASDRETRILVIILAISFAIIVFCLQAQINIILENVLFQRDDLNFALEKLRALSVPNPDPVKPTKEGV